MWFFLGSGDIILINFAFILAHYLRFDTIAISDIYIFLLLVFNFSWILVSAMFSLYTFSRVDHVEHILYNTIRAGITHALIITALLFSIKASEQFSRQLILYTYIIDFIVVIIWRFIAISFIKRYRVSGYNYQRVILVGTGSVSHQMYKFFQSAQSHGFKLLSVFYYQKAKEHYDFSGVDLNNISELEQFCVDNKIDEIYYAMGMKEDDIIHDLISFSDKNMIRLRILPDFSSFLFRKIHVNFYGSLPVITLRDEPLQDEMNRMYKRIFDILFSLTVILLVFPIIFPIIALIIKLSSKGPVFFKQIRSGVNNKDFVCYKFRSMSVNKDADNLQATKNDMRITMIGKFIRKTNIDEFPQFLNVLFGDMSIVGPRPHMVKHTDEYSKLIEDYMVRQLVKPGITGAAQVYGFRGETKTTEDMRNRVEYDIWYLENWSLLLDVKLIFLTVWNMIKGQKEAF
jgi:Undecaprenyl-phosphate glucose phosphotransferase